MLLWIVLPSLFQLLSCELELDSSHEDAQIETLLLQLLHESTELPSFTSPRPQPYFDVGSTTNVTAQLGASVVFHCHVIDLLDQNLLVSWLRREPSQLHLLSVGVEVYSTDDRFTASFAAPNDWKLRLSDTQARDQGVYECQVSSHPPVMLTAHLHVVVPEIHISDERGVSISNKFYNSGSKIELRCSVSRLPEFSSVSWAFGHRRLDSSTRPGTSVRTDLWEDGATSRLQLDTARPSDSGNYSCVLDDLASASATVHVLDGETPAAMQHGIGGTVQPHVWTICHLYLALVTR